LALPQGLRCGQRLLNLTNVRLGEAIISLSRHSEYRMTKRFLRGALVWPSWFYRRSESSRFEPEYLMKCTLRVAHRLHCHGVDPNINYYSVKFHLHETMRQVLRLAGYRPSKGGTAKVHHCPAVREPRRVASRQRDVLRRLAHIPRREDVPEVSDSESEPSEAIRQDKVLGATCPKCGDFYFEVEDESFLKLDFDESKRLEQIQAFGADSVGLEAPYTGPPRLFERPNGNPVSKRLYYQIQAAARSGWYKPRDLKNMFPECNHHELAMTNRSYRLAHPLKCTCDFGTPELDPTEEELIALSLALDQLS